MVLHDLVKLESQGAFPGNDTAVCNAPVEGVYDIQSRFAAAKKANLRCFVFKNHDHDLDYMQWPLTKVISEGLQKIFETSAVF